MRHGKSVIIPYAGATPTFYRNFFMTISISSLNSLVNKELSVYKNVKEIVVNKIIGEVEERLAKFAQNIDNLKNTEDNHFNVDTTRALFDPCLKIPCNLFGSKAVREVPEDIKSAVFGIGIQILEKAHPTLVPVLSMDQFLFKYPEFAELDPFEQKLLLKRDRYTYYALFLKNPRKFKKYFIAGCTKVIEGFDVRFITGGGETAKTDRRVHIFEKVTGVMPIPRAPRQSTASASSGSSAPKPKRKVTHISVVTPPARATSKRQRLERRFLLDMNEASMDFFPSQPLRTPQSADSSDSLLDDRMEVNLEEFDE